MTNPLTDPYLVLSKVYLNGRFLKQAIAETSIEPQNRARCVKIVYGVLEKDLYLGHILGANIKKSPRPAVKLILKIALYMLEFMQKNDYMVVDCAVELTKKVSDESVAKFVNATLRAYKIPPLPENVSERAALECDAPLWLFKRVKRSYKSEASDILSAPSHGVCVAFERNKEKYLSMPHEDTPFENTYIFKNFTRDDGFFAGDYTFRSVGSTAICAAIKGGGKLLDACAAPGGKSVALSKKFDEVVALELHEHRVSLIRDYAERMGVKNVVAAQADGTIFNPEYEEKFDAVLCDAPCSGTGVINENPDIKLFRTEESIAELKKTQIDILNNCSKYVKRGGFLYYSTCSILPEENDSVAHDFLESNREFELSVPLSPLPSSSTRYGLQFLPHISLGAGFFLTAFKRL